MKRVLIIKLWALGDILMATPLLTALRQTEPDRHITWIVDAAHAGILAGHPLIDEVIPLDTRAWRLRLRRGDIAGWLEQGITLNRQMQERRFAAVINCHPEKWWTRWLCAAPVRIGLYPSRALTLSRFAYTQAIPKPPVPRHNTDHYLAAAEALGLSAPFDRRMRLSVSEPDRQAVRSLLEGVPSYQPGKPLVVLHPGASQAAKCWPPSSFAAVADSLGSGYNFVLTGSPNERALAEAVASAMRVPAAIVAAGFLSLRETAALADQAAVVVTGDTSMLHIASALDTPLVGIYLSTRPDDNAPLFGSHRLLFDRGAVSGRGPQEVNPAQVAAAVQSLVKEPHEQSLPA